MLAGDLLVVAACWLLAYAARFYVLGPPLRSRDSPAVSLPVDAAPHPRGVGSLLPRLRPLPAAPHRLPPLGGRRPREGIVARRPCPRGGHDVLVPGVRVLPRRDRVLLAPVHRRRVVRSRGVPGGAALRPAPRLQPALCGRRRRRRSRRDRGEPVGVAHGRGDRGAGRRRRRQGGPGGGAAARRLLGSARRPRRPHGGPRHPRPRTRGLRAPRRPARGGRSTSP